MSSASVALSLRLSTTDLLAFTSLPSPVPLPPHPPPPPLLSLPAKLFSLLDYKCFGVRSTCSTQVQLEAIANQSSPVLQQSHKQHLFLPTDRPFTFYLRHVNTFLLIRIHCFQNFTSIFPMKQPYFHCLMSG